MTVATDVALRVRGLCASLGGVGVLHDVDLTATSGSWSTVIGPNGAGKTTALRVVAGLVQPTAGRIEVQGQPGADLSVRQRARLVAVMPQHPLIPPGVRVIDYVLLGRTAHLDAGLRTDSTDLEVAEAAMASVDLTDFAGRRVDQLSGGERQRVVIARVLAQQASVLLLDEPTTSLDIGHQQEVLETIDHIRRTTGVTVVATMHDLGLAAQYSERIALLVEGRVSADGTPAEVLDSQVLSDAFGADLEVTDDGGDIIVVPRRKRRP